MNEDNIGDIQAEFEGPCECRIGFALRCSCQSHRPNCGRSAAETLFHACTTAGTPYEGGLFRMRLTVPMDFPSTAPKGEHHTSARLHVHSALSFW